jgi:hypothetical protein
MKVMVCTHSAGNLRALSSIILAYLWLSTLRQASLGALTLPVSGGPQATELGIGKNAYAVGRQLHWVVRRPCVEGICNEQQYGTSKQRSHADERELLAH